MPLREGGGERRVGGRGGRADPLLSNYLDHILACPPLPSLPLPLYICTKTRQKIVAFVGFNFFLSEKDTKLAHTLTISVDVHVNE